MSPDEGPGAKSHATILIELPQCIKDHQGTILLEVGTKAAGIKAL